MPDTDGRWRLIVVEGEAPAAITSSIPVPDTDGRWRLIVVEGEAR